MITSEAVRKLPVRNIYIMDGFFIDTAGKSEELKKDNQNEVLWCGFDSGSEVSDEDDQISDVNEEDDNEDTDTCIPLDELSDDEESATDKKCRKQTEQESILENTYLKPSLKHPIKSKMVEELLKKSVIQPGFEQLHAIPLPSQNKKRLRFERKKLRERTKGKDWYDIPAVEVTKEIKADLDVLRMRAALDPKHMYKKNTFKHTPKYFQIGRIVDSPADFYSARIPKSQRKRTMVEELLADSEAKAYQKKKFKAVIAEKGPKRRRSSKNSGKFRKHKKKGNELDSF